VGQIDEGFPLTTSLSKGLTILAVLADASEPVSLSFVARCTGLPKSTIHRIVTELRDAGFVESSADGHSLGLRLFELGGIALRQNQIVSTARPHMEELFERTRHVIQLGILQGTDAMYLVRVGRQGHQLVASHIGGRIPATCTAVGKAILAHDDALLETVIDAGLIRRTRYSMTDAILLRASLAETRRSGIAVELEEARVGLACVASPIIIDGTVRAALSLTAPVHSFEPRAFGPAVRMTAARLSRVLSMHRSASL
jgi:DNA-binding IclR family transcriptional regulator